ncbi:MAG: AAA family ATPase [Polyangiaceae bacterium]
MSPLTLRPLVVLSEHDAGFVSAFPASNPGWVAHADEREGALEELSLFLSAELARRGGMQLFRHLVSEDARLEALKVRLPKPGAKRKAAGVEVELSAVVVPASERKGDWVMIPALDHVVFVPARRPPELDAVVAREAGRLATARSLAGADFIELLPSGSNELLRLDVELDSDRDAADSNGERARKRRTREAKELLESIGRPLRRPAHALVARDAGPLTRSLAGSTRVSAVLIGEPGSGKSLLFQAAAADAMPRVVYATSGAELVAGQSFLGQLEARVQAVMAAVDTLDAALYFENFEDLFAGSPGGYEDIAGAVQRYIESGKVRVYGELTPKSYDRLSHRHVAFFSHLTRLHVEPFDEKTTLAVLAARAENVSRGGGPEVSREALDTLIALTQRYEPYRVQPGKAVGAFDDLLSTRPTDGSEREPKVTRDQVLARFSARTGVPEILLRDERSLDLSDVVRFFQSRIVGQEAAVRRVAETIARIKAGLQPKERPLAQFLFVGPTGVGKTELAKALAELLFGSAERLLRFDMSEYSDAFAAERLIRGTERDEGALTRRIREQPFSVVLLDEIEKADPAVFDLLLQVLGEGRLSDARGRLAHFENAILILTSNLGAQHRSSAVGFGDRNEHDDSHYLSSAREHFRPEFINRLDRIVVFESLDRERMQAVARVALTRIVARQGIDERSLRWVTTDRALSRLSAEGYSRAYGARGLRRHLEQFLVAPAARVVSELGARADGQLLHVRDVDEGPLDLDQLRHELHEPGLTEVLVERVTHGLVVALVSRPARRAKDGGSGALRIAGLRRDAERLHAVPPIRALQERLDEIQADLGLLSGSKRQRRRAPRGAALAELSAEHARLSSLLEPVARHLRELHEIETLSVASLGDGSPPDLLVPDAVESFVKVRRAVGHVLVDSADEHEICMSLVQLGSGTHLLYWLGVLAALARRRGWDTRVYVDRGQRADAPEWPDAKQLRFGPPRGGREIIDQHSDPDHPLPPEVLFAAKGHAAGALLAMLQGILRYRDDAGELDLWVRLIAPRFQPNAEDFARAERRPDVSLGKAVAKKASVRLEVDLRDGSAIYDGETRLAGVDPDDALARLDELAFDDLLARAEVGGSSFVLD